jgi:general secretion pathway protein M
MNSALVQRLRDAWGLLGPRERRLAMIGGAVLALILVYLMLLVPLKQQLARLRTSVPEAQAQLAQMRAQAAMIQPLRGRAAAAPAPGTLVSVIDQSATGHGLRKQLSRLEADGSQGVQVTADAVSFNSLIAWLAELREGHAVVVDNLSLDAHSVPGSVNAKLRLRVETP